MNDRATHPGLRVKDAIRRKGWTQADAATVLGVSQQALSDLCTGKCNISVAMAKRLEAAFGTSAEDWLAERDAWRIAEYERTVDSQPKQSRSADRVASVVARLAFADEAERLLRQIADQDRYNPGDGLVYADPRQIRNVLALLGPALNEPAPMHNLGIVCGKTAIALFDRVTTRDTTYPRVIGKGT